MLRECMYAAPIYRSQSLLSIYARLCLRPIFELIHSFLFVSSTPHHHTVDGHTKYYGRYIEVAEYGVYEANLFSLRPNDIYDGVKLC